VTGRSTLTRAGSAGERPATQTGWLLLPVSTSIRVGIKTPGGGGSAPACHASLSDHDIKAR
jgi:hypothetical protein